MILLSFDIEEFDVPLEHGIELAFDEQMRISIEGTKKILSCLQQHQIKATFFCTANFALHAPDIIQEIVKEGHEIASHGYFHSSFDISDLKKSKKTLEELTGLTVAGFRMARMMPVPERAIYEAGYQYNSSLNPTFIPGRYNHFNQPRTWFYKDNVLQLPSSVTPIIRFPLFWLAYHNLPAALYRWLTYKTFKHDGYIVTYFHPWEFTNLKSHKEWKLPFIMKNHSGKDMEKRLNEFIHYFKQKGCIFGTITQFIEKLQ